MTHLKRPPKFTKFPLRNAEYEVEREIKLWRAVLDQALDDFLTNKDTPEGRRNRRRARIWLRGKSRDFFDVCYLANLHPRNVRTTIFQLVGGEDKLYE